MLNEEFCWYSFEIRLAKGERTMVSNNNDQKNGAKSNDASEIIMAKLRWQY
jgi:hypothetical protein